MAAKFLVAKAVVIAFVWPANASEPNIVIADRNLVHPHSPSIVPSRYSRDSAFETRGGAFAIEHRPRGSMIGAVK
jgi:hypothetical protein